MFFSAFYTETNSGTGTLKLLEKRLSSSGEAHSFALSQADKEKFFWYPLLESLARATLDSRAHISSTAMAVSRPLLNMMHKSGSECVSIRVLARQVMFDILDYHGSIFTYSLWERTVHNVLFQFTAHITTKLEDETQADELSISQALLPDLAAVVEVKLPIAKVLEEEKSLSNLLRLVFVADKERRIAQELRESERLDDLFLYYYPTLDSKFIYQIFFYY